MGGGGKGVNSVFFFLSFFSSSLSQKYYIPIPSYYVLPIDRQEKIMNKR